jgi:hypothetical protein
MVRDCDTALRPKLKERIGEIRDAGILVGAYGCNSEDTTVRVVQIASHGIVDRRHDGEAVDRIDEAFERDG